MVLLNVTQKLLPRKVIHGFAAWSRHRKMMTSARRQARMAFVKLDDEKERLTISFKYESNYVADRLFTINRKQDEPIEKSLSRLQTNISTIAMKKFHKKTKSAKKKSSTVELGDNSSEKTENKTNGTNSNITEDVGEGEGLFKLKIVIEDFNGMVMEPYTHNREAFCTGHTLNVGSTKFPIIVNAPTVVRISLPKIIISGCPVQAYVTLEHAKLSDCVFSWWRTSVKGEKFADYGEGNAIKDKSTTWLRIRGETNGVYWPKEEDVGRKIMVYCEPRSGLDAGVEISAISSSSVTPPLDRCPFEDRHQLTADVLPGNLLRVVSYNLLANIYASTDYSKNVLFNYCPNHALDFEYRKHLLIKELLGYNGDVLCLQEVDRGMFKHELLTCFSLQGFEGIYAEKGAQASEGCAVFFRKSKFSLVKFTAELLSEAIRNEECLVDIRLVIEQNPKLMERLLNRSTILQLILLQHLDTGRKVLVCNTHLYFHPDADHIRLLQAFIAVRLIEQQLRNIEKQEKCPVIFCGDFNSCPEFGVYQLFTTGKASHDLDDWKSNEEESVSGLTASIDLKLCSVYGTPDYTNYTVEFSGCLDYIFHSEELMVTSVVPLPPHELVAHPEYLAIPSPLFPSDHLALVATLGFSNDKING